MGVVIHSVFELSTIPYNPGANTACEEMNEENLYVSNSWKWTYVLRVNHDSTFTIKQAILPIPNILWTHGTLLTEHD